MVSSPKKENGIVGVKLTIKGKVQRVGYRETVQEIAQEHNLTGKVANLKSGEVEVTCEGAKQNIDHFIKTIKIRDGLIEVKNIARTFVEPTYHFKYFEIGYGAVQEELTESIGAGRRELIAIRETLGTKIDDGFSKVDSNFKKLDHKYHLVSKELKSIDRNVSKLNANADNVIRACIKKR